MALAGQRQWTHLHRAAWSGDVDKVRKLLGSGIYSVSCVVRGGGETPLHKAAERGHLDVVRVLVSEFKANVNVLGSSGDMKGDAPLHKAAAEGHLDVVRVLISEFKADVNICGSRNETPLVRAADWGGGATWIWSGC